MTFSRDVIFSEDLFTHLLLIFGFQSWKGW